MPEKRGPEFTEHKWRFKQHSGLAVGPPVKNIELVLDLFLCAAKVLEFLSWLNQEPLALRLILEQCVEEITMTSVGPLQKRRSVERHQLQDFEYATLDRIR